jgi:hypothetical protein
MCGPKPTWKLNQILFIWYGLSETVVSDNETVFTGGRFTQFFCEVKK